MLRPKRPLTRNQVHLMPQLGYSTTRTIESPALLVSDAVPLAYSQGAAPSQEAG